MKTLNSRINQLETTIRKRRLGGPCPACKGRLIPLLVEGQPLPDYMLGEDEDYRCRACGAKPVRVILIVPDGDGESPAHQQPPVT